MHVRLATPADLTRLLALRMALLEESGSPLSPPDRAATAEANERFFRQHLHSSLSVSWVAEHQGEVVAAGTLAFFQRPPYPENLEGKEAYLLNMYTVPEHRGCGAASAILAAAMAHAEAQGCKKVWLHATELGRSLYAKQGFKPSTSHMEAVAWRD